MMDAISEPRKTRAVKAVAAHMWEQQPENWYVDPAWIGFRVAEAEKFEGEVCDPCCGGGNIPRGIIKAGGSPVAFDKVDRGYAPGPVLDFLAHGDFLAYDNFFFNPPFDLGDQFAAKALRLAKRKVAMVYPLRRLPAAHQWIIGTPLYRIWYLTPRPSMVPGDVYRELQERGKEASGGTQDFVVVVWLKGFEGHPQHRWLHRDRGPL